MSIDPTLDLTAAAQCRWDMIVIGAGPAGAVAARELARRGKTVLLVDKSSFPRTKVCGCCLNASALAVLSGVGLTRLVEVCGARPLREMKLASRGCQAKLRIGGHALSREVFDAALVEAAIEAGAHFLPETYARLGEVIGSARTVGLRGAGREIVLSAAVVIGADGLGSRLLSAEPDHQTRVAVGSRLGAGTVARDFPRFYEDATIFMACGAGGYVGLVRLEDGRLNVAAAFDGAFVKQSGGTGNAAAAILDEAGLPPIASFNALPWHGTPLLTRSIDPPAAKRVFLIGDAAGYQEPFTGEGMAWALASAVAVVPLALGAQDCWNSSHVRQWSRVHRQLIARRQWVCRIAAGMLRRPRLVRVIVPTLACFPWLAAPIVRYLNGRPEPVACP